MIHIEEVLEDLEGNGFNQMDLISVSTKLSIFSNLKKELSAIISRYYDEEDLLDLLGALKEPNAERDYISRYLGESLTEKQKEIYLLSVVEGRSMGDIAKLLGLSKSAVQSQLYRAKGKLKDIEIKALGEATPELHQYLMDNSPALTDRDREYYSMRYVEGKKYEQIAEELNVNRRSVGTMLTFAKMKINIPLDLQNANEQRNAFCSLIVS